MKQLKSKVSITLDSVVAEKIQALAERDERSFSQYINIVLKLHIERINLRRQVNEGKTSNERSVQ